MNKDPDIDELVYPVLVRVKRMSDDDAHRMDPNRGKWKPIDWMYNVGAIIATPAISGEGLGSALAKSVGVRAAEGGVALTRGIAGLESEVRPIPKVVRPPARTTFDVPIEGARGPHILTEEELSTIPGHKAPQVEIQMREITATTTSDTVPTDLFRVDEATFENPAFDPVDSFGVNWYDLNTDATRDIIEIPLNKQAPKASTPNAGGRVAKRGELIEMTDLGGGEVATKYSKRQETIFQEEGVVTRKGQQYRDINIANISDIEPLLPLEEEEPILDFSNSRLGFDDAFIEDNIEGMENIPTEFGPLIVPFHLNIYNKRVTGQSNKVTPGHNSLPWQPLVPNQSPFIEIIPSKTRKTVKGKQHVRLIKKKKRKPKHTFSLL